VVVAENVARLRALVEMIPPKPNMEPAKQQALTHLKKSQQRREERGCSWLPYFEGRLRLRSPRERDICVSSVASESLEASLLATGTAKMKEQNKREDTEGEREYIYRQCKLSKMVQ